MKLVGHLPYSRIERLIRRGVWSEIKLDRSVLKSLILGKCDVCIRAKMTENPHKGHLPRAERPWRYFSTDISAKFDEPSIQGNWYQMALIDNFSKMVWDY